MHIGIWDVLLLVAVSLMATAIAYIHNARAKALLLMLPIPFSMATLSLGKPVDVTNVLGLLVLYAFAQATRLLHLRLRVRIVLAIGLAAVGYCLAGWGLAAVVPKSAAVFWGAAALVLATGIVVHVAFHDVDEPGHRSALPIWLKLPAVMLVVALLVCIKNSLQGFMTLFPMVTVVGLYESRHSLATTCRKVGALMFVMLPMLAVMRVAQARFGWGIGASLVAGWAVYLVCLFPVAHEVWRKAGGGNSGE
jgi:hypothetical protein